VNTIASKKAKAKSQNYQRFTLVVKPHNGKRYSMILLWGFFFQSQQKYSG